MKLVGIICEYNPFHLGHGHQLAAAREVSGADTAVVCVMGGNFVQRGEPAIVSKHARARMAVRSGADLVLELPTPWAIASAERFAGGGVAILEAIGADHIAFGAECADLSRLRRVAGTLLTREARAATARHLMTGVSYAAARELAVRELLGEEGGLLKGPNNILAVEYLKAMLRSGSDMSPIAVPRFGPGHDSAEDGPLASASRIREILLRGGDPSPFMPEAAAAVLREEIRRGRGPVRPDALEQAQLYRLRTMTAGEIAALPDCDGGLDRRLYRAVRSQATLEGVLMAVKTKRYALSRLRRTALAALLGVEARHQLGAPAYLRVLAIGRRGREALRRIKAVSDTPIITKPASARLLPPEALEIFNVDVRAGDIYSLAYPDPAARTPGEDWTASPPVEDG